MNPFNIQLLPASLSSKLSASVPGTAKMSAEVERLAKEHLKRHKIPFDKVNPQLLLPSPSSSFLPVLATSSSDATIDSHFRNIAQMTSEPFYAAAVRHAQWASTQIPDGEEKSGATSTLPESWLSLDSQPGWHRYDPSSKSWMAASCGPGDEAVVLDVETCPQAGPWPLLAVALGESGWWAWLSPLLGNPTASPDAYDPKTLLIPLDASCPSKKPQLVIGHNIAYDRARIREEYTIEPYSSAYGLHRRFLDTLSMHCAVAGLSGQQRGLWNEMKNKKKQKQDEEDESAESEDHNDPESVDMLNHLESGGFETGQHANWGRESSLNNLADALFLHCNGRILDKSTRDEVLLKGDLDAVRAQLSRVLEYCTRDVLATTQLYAALWPKFLKKSPHPVTFAALLEMGNFFVPVQVDRWKGYIEKCEKLYQQATDAIEHDLQQLVHDTLKTAIERPELKETDPWLRQLDWTPQEPRYTKARYRKDGSYAKDGEPRPIGDPELFHKPAWYRKILKPENEEPGTEPSKTTKSRTRAKQIHITPKTAIVPYLLKIKWKGQPVMLVPEHGWCHAADASSAAKLIPFAGQNVCKIPHPGGRDDNVGSLLTKNFLKFFDSGEMSTDCPLIKKVLDVNSRFSFWIGYRERIREQFVVPMEADASKESASFGLGLILPVVQPMGTVTRRVVEKTWMTASNAKEKLVGSELKAQVRAPPGFVFVGADVDSQELWIGSLLSDAQFGAAGATAIGWMTLQGSKADGSDLHSRTAAILGMTRDHAKIFNYGRIYGAGMKYAAQLLQRFNPALAASESQAKAQELYRATKGRRASSRGDAFVAYAGGTESFMFNQMEAIARSPSSRTPVLGCEISEALRSAHVADNFLTSRVNWVVQSSGVDYLHLILVAVAFLFRAYGIAGRPVLTIHDELRFLVREEDKWRAALALQIANLWTRIAFSHALGIDELPLSVAFFSAVDMDHCLRKEVGMSCVTPSFTEPEPPGQSVNIYQTLKECPDLGPLLPEWNAKLKSLSKSDSNRPIERQGQGLGIHRTQEQHLSKHLALLKRQIGLPVSVSESEPKPVPISTPIPKPMPMSMSIPRPMPSPIPSRPAAAQTQLDDPSFEEQRKRWSSLISNASKQQ